MKIILCLSAVIGLLGFVAEEKKGWFAVLFVASVLFYIAL